MKPHRMIALTMLASLLMILVSCNGDGNGASSSSAVVASTRASVVEQSTTNSTEATDVDTTAVFDTASPSTAVVVALPQGSDPVELDPATFTQLIDNPYWPMTPGTRWTYREVDDEGVELLVVITVTNETKVVANGITARVVRDTVTEDGEIIEDTIDWYAEDAAGNVWYLGEDTAEFDQGSVTTRAGSWEAGVDGALPGIAVPGNPQVGMRYRQEYYAGQAEDNGEVLSLAESTDVGFGHFDGLLMTEDTSAIDPTLVEHKLYAKGVGPVRLIDVIGGVSEELIAVDEAPPGFGTGPLGSPNP